MILFALFRLAFASAPRLYRLTSHHIVTRRPVLQKVRHHTRMVLCLLVSTRFQVLFHSPPGVLFTVPSRYSSLSVTWSYLALWDGPHIFRQNSSCSDVLFVSSALILSPTGLSPSSEYLSRYLRLELLLHIDTRRELLPPLRAPPLSLATTHGIVITFFSSGY